MAGEVYQAQVIKAFFDVITSTDRNLTRIYLCVVSLAKLRNENPEKLQFLVNQIQKSKEKHQLSIDILDYVVDAANSLENKSTLAAFGIAVTTSSDDFGTISLDSL
ncbi:MAG TPA: hypothetical protein O0X32_00420 [Methanocorpusculum sp.]|nr:hypothetical protein [Methanocorpusculum sp.]